MKSGVILAVRGDREAEIAAAIDSQASIAVARRCADLAEAVAAAEAGVGAIAVVSEQSQLDRSVVKRLMKAGVAVAGVSTSTDDYVALQALGISLVFDRDVDAQTIARGVAGMLAVAGPVAGTVAEPDAADPTADDHAGSIVAVWGPTGAPGRTTLAVNLAAEAAANGVDVVLVDIDTYGGAVGQALGMLDEAPGIAALARAGLKGAVPPALIDRHALAVAKNLRVLSGISRPDRWAELSDTALESVWEALRAAVPLVIVDCGFSIEAGDPGLAARNAATLSALSSADAVVVVGSAEPLGVQRLVQALGELDQAKITERSARTVVINRVRASVAGTRPREAVADALATYASVSEVWTVPDDPRACDMSSLAGQALRERALDSPAQAAIAAIASAVIAGVRLAGFAEVDAAQPPLEPVTGSAPVG